MGAQPAGTVTQSYWKMPWHNNGPAMVESGTGKLFVVTTPDNTKFVSFFWFNSKGYNGSVDTDGKALDGQFLQWDGPTSLSLTVSASKGPLGKRTLLTLVGSCSVGTHYSSSFTGSYSYSIKPNYGHYQYFQINPSVANGIDFRGDLLASVPNYRSRVLA